MCSSTYYGCGLPLKEAAVSHVQRAMDPAQTEPTGKGSWPTPQIPGKKLAATFCSSVTGAYARNHPRCSESLGCYLNCLVESMHLVNTDV